MEILGSLRSAVDAYEKVRSAGDKLKNAELTLALSDLMLKLAEVQTQAAQLQMENVELRAKLQKATEQKPVRPKVALRDGVYYLSEVLEGRPEGPYCPRCLDERGSLMLVTMTPNFAMLGRPYKCPRCREK
ncbi:MAG: hypothetical protein HY943_01340 [Gammaproteobacteria bacterium]|nr:hypothetical protein [Gammaproteobacteria bacterium]